jgi:hypothetical protein
MTWGTLDWEDHTTLSVLALRAKFLALADLAREVDDEMPRRDLLVGALTHVDENGRAASGQRVREWWQHGQGPHHFAWAMLLRDKVVEMPPNHWARGVPTMREDDATPRKRRRIRIDYAEGRVLVVHRSPTLGGGNVTMLRFYEGRQAALALPLPQAPDEAFSQVVGPFTLRDVQTFTCPRCHRESALRFHLADAQMSAIDARRRGGAA